MTENTLKEKAGPSKSHRRPVTIYDAVAERIQNPNSLITLKVQEDGEEINNDHNDTWKPYTPKEILFSKNNFSLPSKIDEADSLYDSWIKRLPSELSLPDSDLLKSIHAYTSDFYSTIPNGDLSYGSMDGTALIAMGMLLEEMSNEIMGETGYLALLESAKSQDKPISTFWNGTRHVPFQYSGNKGAKALRKRKFDEASSDQGD